MVTAGLCTDNFFGKYIFSYFWKQWLLKIHVLVFPDKHQSINFLQKLVKKDIIISNISLIKRNVTKRVDDWYSTRSDIYFKNEKWSKNYSFYDLTLGAVRERKFGSTRVVLARSHKKNWLTTTWTREDGQSYWVKITFKSWGLTLIFIHMVDEIFLYNRLN